MSPPPPTVASVVSIPYQDLVGQDATSKVLLEKVEEAFGAGPDCLGILAVTDLPQEWEEQRRALLPLGLQLSKLEDLEEDCVREEYFFSVGWSHGREQLAPGQPDLAKGSFYANPLTNDVLDVRRRRDDAATVQKLKSLAEEHPDLYAPNVWPKSLPNLEPAFMELGQNIVRAGLRIAAVCDAYCRQQGVETNLHKTLTDSLNVKGRLLHYFDRSKSENDEKQNKNCNDTSMWCGWHNDHGSLTGLIPALYLDDTGNAVEVPDNRAGLYIQSRAGQIIKVQMPLNSCAFQIGEASQIQSGGVLQATPHAVRSSAGGATVTREAFAVFIEPEFDVPLEVPANRSVEDCQAADVNLPPTVLPLRARWRAGHTFGDFHHATVKAFCVDESTSE